MTIALLFRNTASTNLFRDAVLAATGISGATEVLICSGFFQNHFKGSAYCATTEGGLASKLAASGANVVSIGVHNASWKLAFLAFNSALSAAGVKLSTKHVKGYHWHAKVFMVSTVRGPVFAAIGSSNLTRNAFSTTIPFNYEADVLLWVPQARGVSLLVRQVLNDARAIDVIRAPYSVPRNGGLTLRARLRDLRAQILAASV